MNWESKFPGGWYEFLESFILDGGMDKIYSYLGPRVTRGKEIYPASSEVFKAFELTPLDKVKVVIIGREPHKGSNGLAFSIGDRTRRPNYLVNLHRELETDTKQMVLDLSDLSHWAKQGVLLLNTSLTAENGPSHDILWRVFMQEVFTALRSKPALVYILWGKHAATYMEYIDLATAYVLMSGYPGNKIDNSFIGCKHFSKTNEVLTEVGKSLGKEDYTIKW